MYEGMISDLLSGVLQTHQVLLEKAQSCYLGKRMLQKKKYGRLSLIVANVYWRKTFIL